MATLHIHLDESGNFVFSPRGTKFYIFTVAWTYEPQPLADKLNALRFRLVKDGNGENLSGFHASSDPKPRRDLVIEMLVSERNWNFASIVVEKRKVNESIQAETEFYPKFLTSLLKFVFRGRLRPNTNQVLIYTDTLPFPKTQAGNVAVAIKRACRLELGQVPFHIMHHRMESNAWIQVADYCSWAICRKWEHGDADAYGRLLARLAATEIAPMSRGDGTVYY